MGSMDEILDEDTTWHATERKPEEENSTQGDEQDESKVKLLDDDMSDDEVYKKSIKSAPIGSALSSFQKAADRFPPLTPQEQNAYAEQYRLALILKEEIKNGALKGKALKEAEHKVEQAERLMEHLCASCWRLAWMIVREQAEKRFGKERATPLLPDLMAEGNAALVLAVRQFDSKRIPTFHTYAAQVVRDHIRAILSKDSYLQLAPSWNRLKRIAVARLPELVSELGRQPTKGEFQQDLLQRCLIWADEHLTEDQKKLPESQQQVLRMAKLRKQGMIGALRDLDQVLIATQSVASLDAPVGDEGGSTLGDLIKGSASQDSFDALEHSNLSSSISKALMMLSEREREILMLRYGIAGRSEMKYNEIAETFDISAERVRQIERSALAKLSSPHGQFAGLAEFLPSMIDSEIERRGY